MARRTRAAKKTPEPSAQPAVAADEPADTSVIDYLDALSRASFARETQGATPFGERYRSSPRQSVC